MHITTVKDCIINNLKNEYPKEEIKQIINEMKETKIYSAKFLSSKKRNYLFNIGITDIEILMETGIYRLNLETHLYIINQLQIEIKEKIKEKQIKEQQHQQQQKKLKSLNVHNNIINIITEIKSNPIFYKKLTEEIIFLTNYNEQNNKPLKHWQHSALNLDKLEISILRKYLLNKIDFPNIIYNINNKYEILDKIYINLKHFINKLKYKQILNEYYETFEELNLHMIIKSTLKAYNIKNISDLIELSEEKMEEISGLGKKKIAQIIESIENAGIILLNEPTIVSEKLKQENAGIIVSNRKTKC